MTANDAAAASAETTRTPHQVTLMIKPVGAMCNLRCGYCYYLPTLDAVYDGHEHRMSLEVLESVLAGWLPHAGPQVTIAWQGGEPTLAGLDFYRQAARWIEQYRRPNQRVGVALQTNGTLLNDEWCAFFKQHRYLVGLSVDGAPAFHDHYRVDARGEPTYESVVRGLRLLRKHGVEHNLLTVLHDHNVKHPMKVYDFLRNLGANWLQFIPCIEWESDPRTGRRELAAFSPKPADYGRFLCTVFDHWFARERTQVSVRFFDAVLGALVMDQPSLCTLAAKCHNQMTVEHNGDVYGCDHFVEPRWRLGQIGALPVVPLTVGQSGGAAGDQASHQTQAEASRLPGVDEQWLGRMRHDRLETFADRKQDLLPRCDACDYRKVCHGGCPKHRRHGGDATEATILCSGYRAFFDHAMPRLEWLAEHLRCGMQPPPPGCEPVELTPGQKRQPSGGCNGAKRGSAKSRSGKRGRKTARR